MFLLVTVLCQACALTDYFHPPNAERPTLTLAEPCPGGTTEIAAGERIVTCKQNDDERAVRLSFDDHGRVEAYVTLLEGQRHGLSQRWHPNGALAEEAQWRGDQLNGVRRLYDEQQMLLIEERWLNNMREGNFERKLQGKRMEVGQYRAGERTGNWHEWHDGRLARGYYKAGRRIGRWSLGGDDIPDYVVNFTDAGVPIDAERTTKKYQAVMVGVDAAMIGLALYGHYNDRPRLEYAGAAGLLAGAPIIHALYQPSGDRLRKVGESGLIRLASPIAVFGIYSIGKFFDAFSCRDGSSTDESGDPKPCDVRFDYNTKYSVNGIKLATALLIAVGDYSSSFRAKQTTVEEAWPQLAITPTSDGAEVSVAGRF